MTFVYFASCNSRYVKIGIADNPVDRMVSLQVGNPMEIQLVCTLKCLERNQAIELESAFHKFYEAYSTSGEWFEISPDRIKSDIELIRAFPSLIMCEYSITPDRAATKRISLIDVAQRVAESGDENMTADEMMVKYSISLGSTTKIREILKGINDEAPSNNG